MTITIYKDVLYQRMQSLRLEAGKKNTLPSLGALTQLEHAAKNIEQNKSTSVKPIKRFKNSTVLSLYQIGNVPQVKALKLGNGAFARTYLHVDGLPLQEGETHADHIYATKVFKNGNEQDIKYEIELMKKLKRFIRDGVRDCGNGVKKHYIVHKYIPGMNLKEKLDTTTSFTIDQSLRLMLKICQNVQMLHDLGYTHGDLSLRNIMITPELEPVVIDFNYSRPFGQVYHYGYDYRGVAGITQDYPYIAPECCGKADIYFTTASDVYALGHLMSKILENTVCNHKIANAIASHIEDMRVKEPKDRPDLNSVIHSLKIIQARPEQAEVSRRRIDPQMKEEVIKALQNYEKTLGSYVSALVDRDRAEKSNVINGLIVNLEKNNIREDFLLKLKEGFKHYINRFVVRNLEHYVSLPNLGHGLECFISAIKACGIEMDIPGLIKEVEASLPKDSPSASAFAGKLSMELSPRSQVYPRLVKCA